MLVRTLFASACAAAALAACAGGYGSGYGGGTQLSQCTRNALIGAGIGAVAGAAVAGDDDRLEGAGAGAAVGGLGTYGACRLLDAGEQRRIEQAYLTALNTASPYQTSWTAADGSARAVQVAPPTPAPSAPECRVVSATLTVSNRAGVERLPPERYCPTASGWRPV